LTGVIAVLVDRRILRQGPLVSYDRRSGELRIEARDGVIARGQVLEVVKLALPRKAFVFGSGGGSLALFVVVHQCDDRFVVERLFHGYASAESEYDLGGVLARHMGVSYRRIKLSHPDPVLSMFDNTLPPKVLKPSL
jgi:hypothetical protein